MRKRFEAGEEWRVPIYGYRHTEEEMYIIVPEEAEIVREVFMRYAHGETPSEIMRDMIARKVPPPNGNRWKLLQLQRMLHNEKYFHRSLTDNFEWHSGYGERFGLVHVDDARRRRVLKDSAHWYREVAASDGASL